MSPFEKNVQKADVDALQLPSVSVGNKKISFFLYQLATHHFNLKIMASGMKFRNINFTDIKRYYGLKGRSAKDCLGQFEKIMADFKAKYEKEKIQAALN